MNNYFNIYYRVDEDLEVGSWQDKLIRMHHRPTNDRYKCVSRNKRVRYTLRLQLMKRNKRLSPPKKPRNIFEVDISIPNFHPRTFGR